MRSPLFLPALALPLLAMTASAHDPGFSTAIVTVGAREIEAVVTYSLKEIQRDPALPTAGGFQVGDSISTTPFLDAKGGDENLVYRVISPRPTNGELILGAPLLESLAPGHRQHLLVRDTEKAVLLNQFLHRDKISTALALPPVPPHEPPISSLWGVVFEILALPIALWLLLRWRPRRKTIASRST